jgi:hypothetical protein
MIAREVSPYPADMSQWYDEDGHAGRVSERDRSTSYWFRGLNGGWDVSTEGFFFLGD